MGPGVAIIVDTVVSQLRTLTVSKEESNEKHFDFDVLTEQVEHLIQIIKAHAEPIKRTEKGHSHAKTLKHQSKL